MLSFMLGSIVLPAAGSWAGKGAAPVGLGVAMGMGCDVLRGARLAVGKCSGGRRCLLAGVHLPWDNGRFQSTWEDSLGVNVETDGWAG